MYHKHHTKGIVISNKIEGNDSLRTYIFTESFGLLSARVQGARNLRSKLRSGVQDFSLGEFSLIHGKLGWRVVSVRPEKNLFEIFRKDNEKLKIISNIFSLIKKLVGEQIHQNIFSTVANFFNFLEKAQTKDIALAECLTIMRLLYELGYMQHDPELTIPISSSEITIEHLEQIAPRRSQIVALINESLKAT
jgi:DNA repair protein RecO